MITVHNPAPRIANQALARANKSPTSDQLTTALASAGVTAIKLQATLSTGGAVTLTFPRPMHRPPPPRGQFQSVCR